MRILIFLLSVSCYAGDWLTSVPTPGTNSAGNNWWIGTNIGVLPANITITSLNRYCVAGNSQTHVIRLVKASDFSLVATATVNMAGCTAGTMVSAAASGTMVANTGYYLFGAELLGGDTHLDNPVITVRNSAAMAVQGAYNLVTPPALPDAGHLNLVGNNQSVGLYSFSYTPAATSFWSMNPTSAFQGATSFSIRLFGFNTHWDGTTVLGFTSGVGMSVNSLTVTDPESATAIITIAGGATVGSRDVTMTTGAEVVTFTAGFQIVAPVTGSAACSAIALGTTYNQGADFNGFIPFPLSPGWHANISGLPVDTLSSGYVTSLLQSSPTRPLISNYPPTATQLNFTQGLQYSVVDNSQPGVAVPLSSPAESDPGPYPIPFPALVSGVQTPSPPTGTFDYSQASDKQVIVINRDKCLAYEFDAFNFGGGVAGSNAHVAAVWDLLGGDHQRPYEFTSNGVSGLPRMAALVRGDELQAGTIAHPLGVTAYLGNLSLGYTDMASHAQGGGGWDSTKCPFGCKVRLKSSFDVSPYTSQGQLLLNTLKAYGGVLMDGGEVVALYGRSDSRWDTTTTNQLRLSPPLNDIFDATSFDVVATGTVYCAVRLFCGHYAPTGPVPVISSFTGPGSVGAGGGTLSVGTITGNGSRIVYITPEIGASVLSTIPINPLTTTTYSAYAQNQYGRSTVSTVTVTQTLTTTFSLHFPALAATANLTVTTPDGQTATLNGCAGTGGTDVNCTMTVNPTVPNQTLTVSYFTGGSALISSGSMRVN